MNQWRCEVEPQNCNRSFPNVDPMDGGPAGYFFGWLKYPYVGPSALLPGSEDVAYTLRSNFFAGGRGRGTYYFNLATQSYDNVGYPWPGEYDTHPWITCQEPCYRLINEDGSPIGPSPIHLCRYNWQRTTRPKPAWILFGPFWGQEVGRQGPYWVRACPNDIYIPYGQVHADPGELPPITPPMWQSVPDASGIVGPDGTLIRYQATPAIFNTSNWPGPDTCRGMPLPADTLWPDTGFIDQWVSGPGAAIIVGVQADEQSVTLDLYIAYNDADYLRLNANQVSPAFIFDKYALIAGTQQVTRFVASGNCVPFSLSPSLSLSPSPSTSVSPSHSPSPSGYISSQSPSPSPSPSQEAPLVEPGMVMVGQTYNVMLYRVDPIETDICVASANVGSSNWQNPSDRFDVLGDGVVDARDYQALQSYANSHGYGPLPTQKPNGQPYVDVNGDGSLSAADLEQLATFLETGNVFDTRTGRCFPVNDFTVFYDIIDPARVEKVLNGAAIIGAYPRDLYYPVWIDCPTRSFSLADYHDEVPWQTHLVFVHKTLVVPPHEYRRGCRTDPILDSAFWPRLLDRICSRLRIPEVSPSPLPPMSVPPATILPVIGVNIRIALLAIYDEADEYYVGSYPFYTIADRVTSAGREKFVEDRTYWEQTICLVEERFDHLVRVRMGIAQPVRNKEVSGQWEIKCDRCEMPGDSDRISIDYLRIPAPIWPEKYRVPRITANEILALFDGLTTTAYGEAPWDPDFLLCILDNSGSIRVADYSDELSTVKEELTSRYPTLRIRPDVVTGKPERWLRVAAESLRTLLRIPLEATPLECLPPEQRQYASLSASPSPNMSPSPSPSPEPGDGHEGDCGGRGWQPGAWYHPLTVIDFGTLPRGTGLAYTTVHNGVKTGYKRAVNIKNTGTSAGSGGCITDTPPFYQNWAYLDLAVGQTKTLEVIVDTATPGEYTLDMVWYCGVRQDWPDPGPGPNGDPVRCHVIIV